LVGELKATGQAIRESKLSYANEDGLVGPDCRLLPKFWGHKYGAEVWRAFVAYEFAHTDCMAVEATPNVDNIASIKIQESAGAVRVGEVPD